MVSHRLIIGGHPVRVCAWRDRYGLFYLAERFDAGWKTRPVDGPQRIFTARRLGQAVNKAMAA